MTTTNDRDSTEIWYSSGQTYPRLPDEDFFTYIYRVGRELGVERKKELMERPETNWQGEGF